MSHINHIYNIINLTGYHFYPFLHRTVNLQHRPQSFRIHNPNGVENISCCLDVLINFLFLFGLYVQRSNCLHICQVKFGGLVCTHTYPPELVVSGTKMLFPSACLIPIVHPNANSFLGEQCTGIQSSRSVAHCRQFQWRTGVTFLSQSALSF